MSELTCKPSLFIVGAPKSGTTSLHNYLSQHPDVFMSKNKEPCFLAPDFSSPVYPKNEEEYLRCFEGYNGQRQVGESTSTYLYSKLAAKRIHEYSPGAKVIVMLRNPVDLVPSLHAQRLKEGSENIVRLEDALEAESDRRNGRRIPSGFRYPKEYLLYRDYGRYTEQLTRYYQEFKDACIHVIIFDDFAKDAAVEYGKVCRFLGIAADFKPDMEIHNPARTPRSLMLHRGFTLLSPTIAAIATWLRPIMPSKAMTLLSRTRKRIVNANMTTGRRDVAASTRQNLTSYYQQEIMDLESLLDVDLSCWRVTNELPDTK